MTAGTRFTSDVFKSTENLQHFLDEREAIQEISKNYHAPASSHKIQSPSLARLSWRVLTEPFIEIFAVFVQKIGHLLIALEVREIGAKWVIYGEHQSLRDDSYYKGILGKRFLVRTINLPSLDRSDVFTHPPIKASEIKDENIRLLLHPEIKTLQLLNYKGVCLGGSNLFSSLYVKTRHLYPDTKRHLIAIARLFQKGVPVAGQVLHKFQNRDIKENPLLGLTKREVVELKNTGTDKEKLIKLTTLFIKIAPGFYSIETPTHELNLIKTDFQTLYTLDLNFGLIESSNAKDHLDMANIILGTYRKKNSPTLLKIKQVTGHRFSQAARAA